MPEKVIEVVVWLGKSLVASVVETDQTKLFPEQHHLVVRSSAFS
jgi:hypothetical protein